MKQSLPPLRKWVHPEPGDSWESIAQRVLPDSDTTTAVENLQSWNLHITFGIPMNVLLPTHILFTEPPTA